MSDKKFRGAYSKLLDSLIKSEKLEIVKGHIDKARQELALLDEQELLDIDSIVGGNVKAFNRSFDDIMVRIERLERNE